MSVATNPEKTDLLEKPAVVPVAEVPVTTGRKKIEDATPEELATQHQEWIERQFPSASKRVAAKVAAAKLEEKAREEATPESKVEESAAVVPVVEKPKKEEAKESPAKANRKTVEVPPLPAKPEISEEAIAKRVTEAVTAATKPQEPTLTAVEQKQLAAFEQMAKADKRYAELPTAVKAYWKKESEYQAKWEKDNPGEEFNPDADDHIAFYKKHTPSYDESDFESARETVIEERIKAEVTRESKERETKTESRQALQRHEAELPKITDSGVAEFASLAHDEFGTLIGEGKRITPEMETKMEEADPLAKQILVEEGEPLSIMLAEHSKLTQFLDAYPPNYNAAVRLQNSDRVIYPHAELVSFMMELEQKLVARPPDETMRDGKRLVSNAQFTTEVNTINGDRSLSDGERKRRLQALGASYYALNDEDFRAGLIGAAAAKAKKRIAQGQKIIEAKLAKNGKPEGKAVETSKDTKPAEVKPDATKTKSPSVASASDNVDTRKSNAVGTEEKQDFFINRMYGG